jgi:microcystin-dependent protein
MEDPRISQQNVAQPLSGSEALPVVQMSINTGNLRTLRTDINALKDFLVKDFVNALYPAGAIMPYASNVVDASMGNWLLCDGRSVSLSAYPRLYKSIGKTYGSVDDNSFNLPNLQGRVIIGYCDVLPTQTFNFGKWDTNTSVGVGSIGGAYNYKLSQSNVPITFFNVPTGTGSNVNPVVKQSSNPSPANVMQPYMALNYIIKY